MDEDDMVGDGIQYGIVLYVLGMLASKGTGFWLSVAIGGMVNGVLAKLLKRAVQAPRPVPVKRATTGMPSSHAYLLFFFSSLAKHSSFEDGHWMGLTVASAAVCLHRVAYQYHTLEQCVVGACVGWGMAIAWQASSLHAELQSRPPFDRVALGSVLAGVVLAGLAISKFRTVFTG
ncbi:hypothetical protein BASA81_003002 [Batrachochytrium salamandrivorans]|nr:hypothetical protein BASA81_003002 [Batrachochytrium salamandrivorans]